VKKVSDFAKFSTTTIPLFYLFFENLCAFLTGAAAGLLAAVAEAEAGAGAGAGTVGAGAAAGLLAAAAAGAGVLKQAVYSVFT